MFFLAITNASVVLDNCFMFLFCSLRKTIDSLKKQIEQHKKDINNLHTEAALIVRKGLKSSVSFRFLNSWYLFILLNQTPKWNSI